MIYFRYGAAKVTGQSAGRELILLSLRSSKSLFWLSEVCSQKSLSAAAIVFRAKFGDLSIGFITGRKRETLCVKIAKCQR